MPAAETPTELILPFAGVPLAEDGSPALSPPPLPNLVALLSRLDGPERDDGDVYALSPPHERALARVLGFEARDGLLPLAAHAAAADGIATTDQAWGLLSPVHWQVGRENVSMGDPRALALDEAASRAFFDALHPLFASAGWVLLWGTPERWYLAHESLAELPTASLDRVIGRNPDLWLPDAPAAKPIKRLFSEAQMLLYTHPLNEAREAQGLSPLNSLWLSGCGVRQKPRADADVRIETSLRDAALAADGEQWTTAWAALDAGLMRTLSDRAEDGNAPFALTLCGERSATRYTTPTTRPGAWQRLRRAVSAPRVDVAALLNTL